MSYRGHGIIVNIQSKAPFVFEFNPESIESTKKINYVSSPNIGGAYKQKFFTGFDSKEVSLDLVLVDMVSPTGVSEEIAFFEALREPSEGALPSFNLTYGNKNYPPPQVYFQFGVSFVPLVWDVLDVGIKEDHFYSGAVSGILGIPKKADIHLVLSLVEGDPINQANQIAKKMAVYAASAKSIVREVQSINGKRKERYMNGSKSLQGK